VRVFVKICGLTREADVAAAVEAGADAVGFVLAASPRRVAPARAAALAAGVPAGVLRVAVLRHPASEEWAGAWRDFAPDWVQADAADFAGRALPPGALGLPVYRDLPDLDEARVAREPRVLFEAAQSGTGTRADWGRAAVLARRTSLVLAGGLTPANVAVAIRTVRPWGVDVSSGVEASPGIRPGTKDAARIRDFVAAVRAAGRELTHADE
jgi:phosphoribosylanthranilate isomerase